jgi:Kef-type K+ transport system membrane component KefB
MRCAFYSVFFVAVMLYYGYMGYLFKNNKVSESARAALLIVAVCVCLLSVLFLGVWIYQHLFRITQGTVSKVLSLDERRVRPTPGSCKVHPK